MAPHRTHSTDFERQVALDLNRPVFAGGHLV